LTSIVTRHPGIAFLHSLTKPQLITSFAAGKPPWQSA
jgi:hypothetical protein